MGNWEENLGDCGHGKGLFYGLCSWVVVFSWSFSLSMKNPFSGSRNFFHFLSSFFFSKHFGRFKSCEV